jgi:hypothetical protein
VVRRRPQWALLIALLTIGCTTTSEVAVTSYFKLRVSRPTVDWPHLFQSGDRSGEILLKVGPTWERLQEGLHLSAWSLAGGAAVAFDNGGGGSVAIVSADGRRWQIPCDGYQLAVEPSGRALYCLDHPRLKRSMDLVEGQIRLRAYAWTGEAIKTYAPQMISVRSQGSQDASPAAIGFLQSGAPVVLVECPADVGSWKPRRCVLLSPTRAPGDDVLEKVAEGVATDCERPSTWNGHLVAPQTIQSLEAVTLDAY